jgi:hypothetical protein
MQSIAWVGQKVGLKGKLRIEGLESLKIKQDGERTERF